MDFDFKKAISGEYIVTRESDGAKVMVAEELNDHGFVEGTLPDGNYHSYYDDGMPVGGGPDEYLTISSRSIK